MKSTIKKVNQNQVNSDFQWLTMQSLAKYKGQWIAVSEKEIVARGIGTKLARSDSHSKNIM